MRLRNGLAHAEATRRGGRRRNSLFFEALGRAVCVVVLVGTADVAGAQPDVAGSVIAADTRMPLPGVQVRYHEFRDTDYQLVVYTDAAGRFMFQIDPLVAGHVGLISVDADGYNLAWLPWPPADGVGSELEFVLTKPSTIYGRIVDGTSGEPIGGTVMVEWTMPHGGALVSDAAAADNTGAFEMRVPGDFPRPRVIAWANRYAPALEVRFGYSDVDRPQTRLERLGSLSGQLIQEEGQAVVGALIHARYATATDLPAWIVDNLAGQRLLTDTSGSFVVEDLVPHHPIVLWAELPDGSSSDLGTVQGVESGERHQEVFAWHSER